MIGKVKQWLGIEGVKLEIQLPDSFDPAARTLAGTISLTSKHPQTVGAIKIALIEKYTRGREAGTLVDEYELGTRVLRQTISVPGDELPVEVPFTIDFAPVQSPVEEFGSRNVLFKGLAWVAKQTRNASSEYRLEAEAQVRGVGLNPFDKKVIG